jgi:hypothetical protein
MKGRDIKFGNLILHSSNGKSGMGEIRTNRGNIFRNTIGIYKGSSDLQLDFAGGVADSFWHARGITRIKQMGNSSRKMLTVGPLIISALTLQQHGIRQRPM